MCYLPARRSVLFATIFVFVTICGFVHVTHCDTVTGVIVGTDEVLSKSLALLVVMSSYI